MIVLWNSAAMTVYCALVESGETYEYSWEANRSLAHDMLAYLRDRLDEHGRTFDDITGIGVFRGPGSYTGLRIGLTVLNTLANARQIPIVGVTGDAWTDQALKRLDAGRDDKIVLPEYGGEARVTQPRK